MNQEIRKRTGRALCIIHCIGAPGHHEQCYFPKAYVVRTRYTFFEHIAEQFCKELGLPTSEIEEMTIHDGWLEHYHEMMPLTEQRKINKDIETQKVSTTITESMREAWRIADEKNKQSKTYNEEEESC